MLLSTGLFDEHLSELDVWLTMLARVKAKDLILKLLEKSLLQVRVCGAVQNLRARMAPNYATLAFS